MTAWPNDQTRGLNKMADIDCTNERYRLNLMNIFGTIVDRGVQFRGKIFVPITFLLSSLPRNAGALLLLLVSRWKR